MVKIKNIIKSKKAVLCFLAFIFLIIILGFSFVAPESGVFSPSPSRIVLNKWKNENNRKTAITHTDIINPALFKTKLSTVPSSQSQIVFKTDNLRFMLFAKGKIIFKNTDKKFGGYGKEIHIIDIRDIKEGSQLYLFLSPINGVSGRIDSEIFITSKNDYLLDLICENAELILILTAVIILIIILLIIGIINLFEKKKSAPKFIYLSCCLTVLFLILLLKSDIYQFFISPSPASYAALYSSYSLLGIFISILLCSLLKLKSNAVFTLNILNFAYSVFRIILFSYFLIPFENAVFVSHFLLIINILFPIILKLCRSRQSFDYFTD